MALSNYHALVLRAFKFIEKGKLDDARALIALLDDTELEDLHATCRQLDLFVHGATEARRLLSRYT